MKLLFLLLICITLQGHRVDLIEHLKDREGVVYASYPDSLKKPTGGVGHLLTQEEQLLYPIKYVNGKPIGTPIPENVVNQWLEQDVKIAKAAAKNQLAELPNKPTQQFENALIGVNFQLGTSWYKEHKKTWKYLKEGKYTEASKEVFDSTWHKQTPVRTKDFNKAILQFRDGVETQQYFADSTVNNTNNKGLFKKLKDLF